MTQMGRSILIRSAKLSVNFLRETTEFAIARGVFPKLECGFSGFGAVLNGSSAWLSGNPLDTLNSVYVLTAGYGEYIIAVE